VVYFTLKGFVPLFIDNNVAAILNMNKTGYIRIRLEAGATIATKGSSYTKGRR
jgi:hypothetical protein